MKKVQDSNLEMTEKNSNLDGTFTKSLIYCVCVTVLGGTFFAGFHITLFNTPTEVLKDFYNSTYFERYNHTSSDVTIFWSLANGALPLGGSFGGLITGIVVKRFGSKNGMLVVNSVVLIGGILFAISKEIKSYETLVIARFLTGFISGFFCGICSLYLSEISPKNLRGFIGTINGLSICVGALVANVLGLPQILGTSELWPYLLGLTLVSFFIHIIGLPFAVESPKYLYITKNDSAKARRALKTLRLNENLVQNEIEELEQEKEKMMSQVKVSYGSLIKESYLRKALLVAVVLQAAQQFSGILVVSVYSTPIFISLGLEAKTWAVYATMFVTFIEVLAHMVTMVLIDKVGRRILLIISMTGMSIGCFILAVTSLLKDELDWLKYVSVVAIVLYMIFYSLGAGPIPLLVTAELFETEARGKAVSIAVFFNWFFNFIVTTSYPYIDELIGNYSFIIYGVFLVFFIIFTFFQVPETKNKSIDEITSYFKNKNYNTNDSKLNLTDSKYTYQF